MAKPSIPKHHRKSLIEGQAKPRSDSFREKQRMEYSFLHLDENQSPLGQKLLEWEEDGLLSKMVQRFKDVSSLEWPPFNDKFKRYDTWHQNCQFKWPGNVPDDACWASMHIQGKECVIGHIVQTVFYVVFLDRNHQFWPTEKKNT